MTGKGLSLILMLYFYFTFDIYRHIGPINLTKSLTFFVLTPCLGLENREVTVNTSYKKKKKN